MGKLKNGKYVGGGNRVVEWNWRLCNMTFESGAVPEDWRSVVIFHYTRAKERELYIKIIEVTAC